MAAPLSTVIKCAHIAVLANLRASRRMRNFLDPSIALRSRAAIRPHLGERQGRGALRPSVEGAIGSMATPDAVASRLWRRPNVNGLNDLRLLSPKMRLATQRVTRQVPAINKPNL